MDDDPLEIWMFALLVVGVFLAVLTTPFDGLRIVVSLILLVLMAGTVAAIVTIQEDWPRKEGDTGETIANGEQ